MNAELLSISTDSVFSHKVFKETSPSLKNVAYPMVSDRTQVISRAYRVLDEETGAAFRASVFVDPEGIIRAKLIYPVNIGRNIPEHLRILQAFEYAKQTGKVVPANWVPGQQGVSTDPSRIGET
jgi:alkyl hydroperoxide reductase subunit AhpC